MRGIAWALASCVLFFFVGMIATLALHRPQWFVFGMIALTLGYAPFWLPVAATSFLLFMISKKKISPTEKQ